MLYLFDIEKKIFKLLFFLIIKIVCVKIKGKVRYYIFLNVKYKMNFDEINVVFFMLVLRECVKYLSNC